MNPETIVKTISDLYLHAMKVGLEDANMNSAYPKVVN